MSTSPAKRAPAAWIAAGATLVAIMPFVVAAATNIGASVHPSGDYALIDYGARNAFSADGPLLGVYSRAGWYHPGPSFFWALAPFTFLAGGAAWGTVVGGAAVQAGAVAWSARVAWRVGGLMVVLLALTVHALTYVALAEREPWHYPWNPYVAVPFVVLFALLVWSVDRMGTSSLAGAVLVGSFLIHTHIGYAPIVGAGGAWIAVTLRSRHRIDPEDRSRSRRDPIVASAVAAVLWLPPVLEQLTKDPFRGNLARIASYFLTGESSYRTDSLINEDPAPGLATAFRIFAADFRWVPRWLGGAEPTDSPAKVATPGSWLQVVILAVVVVGSLVIARRTGRSTPARAIVLVSSFVAAGVVAIARMRGVRAEFLLLWRIPLIIALLLTSVVAVMSSSRRWSGRAAALGATVLAMVITAGSLYSSIRATDRRIAEAVPRGVVGELIAQTEREVPAGRVMVRGTVGYVALTAAVFNEMDRRSLPVSTTRTFSRNYLEGRRGASARDVTEIWYVVIGWELSVSATQEGARVLATHSPLSEVDESRLRHLQSSIFSSLVAADQLELLIYLDAPDAFTRLAATPGVRAEMLDELGTLLAAVQRAGEARYGIVALPASHRMPDHLVSI